MKILLFALIEGNESNKIKMHIHSTAHYDQHEITDNLWFNKFYNSICCGYRMWSAYASIWKAYENIYQYAYYAGPFQYSMYRSTIHRTHKREWMAKSTQYSLRILLTDLKFRAVRTFKIRFTFRSDLIVWSKTFFLNLPFKNCKK